MKKNLTKSELQNALRNANIQFATSADVESLRALCVENGISTQKEDEVAEIVVSTSFGDFSPKKSNDEKIKSFISSKEKKNFPDFIGKLPVGNYETTGLCDIYQWKHLVEGEELVTELLLIFLKDENGEMFPVGSWDLVERSLTIKTAKGEEILPKWINSGLASSTVDRDKRAISTAAGIKVRVRKVEGHWHNPFKQPKGNYLLTFVELAD